MPKGFAFRQSEIVPAASFVMSSFSRDREELETRFSEFTTGYAKSFGDQRNLVDGLEQGLSMTQEQKATTESLYAKADELDRELNFVAFYFKRAQLDGKLISGVKKVLRRGDIEGTLLKVQALQQYLTANLALLTDKGMAPTFPAELEATRSELAQKNTAQNELMNQRRELYAANRKEYERLYGYIQTISQAGKIMYQGKPKSDEYNLSKILGRMRFSGGGGGAPASGENV